MWNVANRGFLPTTDPITSLPVGDIRNTELVFTWENFSNVLPHYLKEDCLREELICDFRKASHSYYHGMVDNLGGPSSYERTFLLLAYFATAYINAPEGKRRTKLPKEITVPFARVAHLVGRQPVIDYPSYVLYNWKRKNEAKEPTRDNIEILHTFTDSDEEKLILSTLIEMELIGNVILTNLERPLVVLDHLRRINSLLETSWRSVSFAFLNQWSHLLSDYRDLKYEQWRPDELTFECDIPLQTPLLETLYRYLDIGFKNDYLTKRRHDLLYSHRPAAHRDFIAGAGCIRGKCAENESNRKVYNDCVDELVTFRNHLILRKTDKNMGIIAANEINGYYLM